MSKTVLSANSDNLSAVLKKKGELVLEQTPLPDSPGKNEVLLATNSVGICGSDVHYWVNGCIGDFVVRNPMILGHETSADVVAVGEGVKHLKPGDRVAVEPGVPCRCCNFCKEGQYNLCPDITFSATPPVDGTLTRYFKHAADFCFKLPDHVTYEEGALLEPLSVAVHANRRADVTVGDNVLILGSGPIGLVSIIVAKAYGATKILATDILESRLAIAKEVGADHTLLIKPGETTDQVIERVKKQFDFTADKSIECSGNELSTKLSILLTKSGGTVVLVGLGASEVTVPLVNAATREVDIRGVFRYRNCYPIGLDLIASGKINVKPLVTHRYKLEQTLDAFSMAKSGEAIKVMINCTKG